MDDHRKYVTSPRDLAAAHCRSASVIENRCIELSRDEPQNVGDHAAMFISSAMLRAFSIELALKSLAYVEKSKWEVGHDLKSLFGKLTAQSQNLIKRKADAELGRSFDDVLSEVSSVFVDWRYVHEKIGTDEALGFDTDEMKTIAHSVLQVLDDRLVSSV